MAYAIVFQVLDINELNRAAGSLNAKACDVRAVDFVGPMAGVNLVPYQEADL